MGLAVFEIRILCWLFELPLKYPDFPSPQSLYPLPFKIGQTRKPITWRSVLNLLWIYLLFETFTHVTYFLVSFIWLVPWQHHFCLSSRPFPLSSITTICMRKKLNFLQQSAWVRRAWTRGRSWSSLTTTFQISVAWKNRGGISSMFSFPTNSLLFFTWY